MEAEAAYRVNYDLPAAVRWYELHLEHAPQSVSGHNNRGVYLSSLGRYEEALEEFQTATRLDPFGPSQAQVQLFNQVAILVALGRSREAIEVSRQLTGHFAEYATLLQATAAGRWKEIEPLAEGLAGPATPSWLRAPAVTLLAGALTAQDNVAAAEEILRQAADSARGPTSYWYWQARLVLAIASGQPPRVDERLMRDTTAAGLTLAGLTSALAGDTSAARTMLVRVKRLPAIEQLRLGNGPLLLEASIAARGQRWEEVIRLLGPSAQRGEHDGSTPAQVASVSVRWLVADAYERIGRRDSAEVYYELAIAPTRVPFGHLALRGLAYPFVQRRLARIRGSNEHLNPPGGPNANEAAAGARRHDRGRYRV
jgi:tetratricopeptide (TPR) repeat protein